MALSISTFPLARFDLPHRFPIFFKSRPNGGNGNSCAFRNGGGKGRFAKLGGIGSPGGGKGPGGSIGKGKNGMAGFPGELESSFDSDGGFPQFGNPPFFHPPGGGGSGGGASWPGRGIMGRAADMPAGNGGGINGGGTSQGWGGFPPGFGAALSVISKNFPCSGFGSRFVLIGLNFESERLRSLLQSSTKGAPSDFFFTGGSVCIGVSDSSDLVSKNKLSAMCLSFPFVFPSRK